MNLQLWSFFFGQVLLTLVVRHSDANRAGLAFDHLVFQLDHGDCVSVMARTK